MKLFNTTRKLMNIGKKAFLVIVGIQLIISPVSCMNCSDRLLEETSKNKLDQESSSLDYQRLLLEYFAKNYEMLKYTYISDSLHYMLMLYRNAHYNNFLLSSDEVTCMTNKYYSSKDSRNTLKSSSEDFDKGVALRYFAEHFTFISENLNSDHPFYTLYQDISKAIATIMHSKIALDENKPFKKFDTTFTVLKEFYKHPGCISSLTCSSDGQTILTGSYDHTVQLWHIQTGKLLLQFQGHSDIISSVAFSPKGKMVLTTSWDKTARLWSTHTGNQIQLIEIDDRIFSAAFSPDEAMIFIGTDNGAALLWNIQTEKLGPLLSWHTGAIWSAAFNPSGEMIITGSADKTARLWNSQSGTLLQEFIVEGIVRVVAFRPDGKRILIASDDDKIRLFDTQTKKIIQKLEKQCGEMAIWSAAFHPKGLMVISKNVSDSVDLWNVKTGGIIQTLPESKRVVKALFSPDGEMIFTGSLDGIVQLWRRTPDNVVNWINEACFLYKCFIVKAVDTKKRAGSFVIQANSAEHKIFVQLPDHIKNYIVEWYSLALAS